MAMELTERQLISLQEIFITFPTDAVDHPDWGDAPDSFMGWILDTDFKNESFRRFAEWIYFDKKGEPVEKFWIEKEEKEHEWDDEPEPNPNAWDYWNFFYGYGKDYEKFANDWVVPEDRDDYFEYLRFDGRLEKNV
jgi:hypothetical protein